MAAAARYPAPAMTFGRRMWGRLSAAVGSLTVLGDGARGASRQTLAESLAFYPAVGLGMGAVAAAVAAGVARIAPPLAGPAGVLVLEALAGGRPRRAFAAVASAVLGAGPTPVLERLRARPTPAGVVLALAALGVKLWAATALTPPARTAGLLLAPMLGRWAMVVQCYGGAPGRARGPAAALVGRARFEEFGWASLVAFAVTLSAAEAIGLLVLVVAAIATLAVRLWAHRRVGGMTGRLLAATAEVVESAVLLALALLRRAPVS